VKVFLALFVILFFSGCGGGGSNHTSVSEKYPLHKDINVTYFYVGGKGSRNNQYIPSIASAWGGTISKYK